MSTVRFEPAGALRGELRPPPDKSISHRAALFGAMGEGESRIGHFLDSADTRSTLAAVAATGARVEVGDLDASGGLEVRIEGVGLRAAAPAQIDVGNAGTLLRIMPGWLAGQPKGEWTLDGDESIRRRPVDRIAAPLRAMGAEIECRDEKLPPLRVTGSELRGVEHHLPIASAQVKSCLLIAGLLASGRTTVIEPLRSRDHTERMLRAGGVEVGEAGTDLTVTSVDRLEPLQLEVPGDFSSAAFFTVAATLIAGSELQLTGVGLNPTRTGLLEIMGRMGASPETGAVSDSGGEPAGELLVRQASLSGTTVTAAEVPLTIDELPLVALLGCFAEGKTVVEGAAELRAKESDRIAAVVDGLGGLGAEIEGREDGFVVTGSGGLRGGAIDAKGDHRTAMLGAIAGLASREGVDVRGFEAVAVSYPGFEADLRALV